MPVNNIDYVLFNCIISHLRRGKTVVHWQARRFHVKEVLWQLVCLNDRFALDGLSPPSYGGLLWCFGWSDKPADGQRVTEKWAQRYRTGPEGFDHAKELLLSSDAQNSEMQSKEWSHASKKARLNHEEYSKEQKPHQKTTILSFFSPVKENLLKDDDVHKTMG